MVGDKNNEMKDLLKQPVLLLNATYEVIGTVLVKDVFGMLYREHNPAKVEKYMSNAVLHSGGGREHKVPSVVRLSEYINIVGNKRRTKIRKSQIFQRDFYRCGYCIKKFKPKFLTLDHVMPKSRGGSNDPSNLVTACFPCNQKKADKTPEEANMRLVNPVQRRNEEMETRKYLMRFLGERPEWRNYLYE